MRAMSGEPMSEGMHEQQCTVTLHRTTQEDFLLRRARGDFRESPGLRLTIEEAMRLWDLDRDTCAALLASLVEAKFLELDTQGRYRKAHSGC
jgi:hypothetical protein